MMFGVISYAALLVDAILPLGIDDLRHDAEAMALEDQNDSVPQGTWIERLTHMGFEEPASGRRAGRAELIWDAACQNWLRRLTLFVQKALTDLTESQFSQLAESEIYLCGPHATIPNLGPAIESTVGIPVHIRATNTPPAIYGNRKYLEHLKEWKLSSD